MSQKDFTKCRFNEKIVRARVSSHPSLIEYYYETDETKHIYKVQTSFFKKYARLVK